MLGAIAMRSVNRILTNISASDIFDISKADILCNDALIYDILVVMQRIMRAKQWKSGRW